MKEVTINNTTYVSIASLAKEFKYTTDYLGQLCRAKKVDAQLVGRSWYLNPESLKSLRTGGRYSRNKSVGLPKEAVEIPINVIPVKVDPVVRKSVVKMAEYKERSSINFAKRIDWKPLKYEVDSGVLIPALHSGVPERIRVNLAESSELAIKSGPKSTSFISEELPTVMLKGSVSVSSLDRDFDLTEDFPDEVSYPKAFFEREVNVIKTIERREVPRRQHQQREVSVPVVENPVIAPGFNQIEILLSVTTTVLAGFLLCILFLESQTIATSISASASEYLINGDSFFALLSKF